MPHTDRAHHALRIANLFHCISMVFELFSRRGQLETTDGHRFRVKGISWFGADCLDNFLTGLWANSLTAMLDTLKQDRFNLLRVPIANDTISQLDTLYPTTVNFDKNPDLKDKNTGQALQLLVEECATRGILVVWDNQKLYRSQSVAPTWWDSATGERQVLDNMKTMASRYQQWNVVGYDILNEPHDDTLTWGTGDPRSDFRAFAGRAGDAIHSVNPRLLIGVEGLPWCKRENDWGCWGSCLQCARESGDVQLAHKDKLVYLPHQYPPGIAKSDSGPDKWQSRMGWIKDRAGPAVVVGEHGSFSTDCPDRHWQDAFGDWLIRKDLDAIYWSVPPSGGDTGGYFLDDWTRVDPWKRNLLNRIHMNPSVAQNSNQAALKASPVPSTPVAGRPQLFSRDNHFWAADGSKFYLKGISWFGLETPDQSLQGLWSVSMESILDRLQTEGFNFLRVPFSAQLVDTGLDVCKPTNLNGSCNPALAGATSGALLDRLFVLCAERNIGIMLDLHRLVNTQQQPLWYSDKYPESKVISIWKTIAARYAAAPAFLAVDLFNEPQNGATWGGDPTCDWKSAAERIGAAVLGVAPHLLVGVQGVGQPGPGQTASWWGGNVSGQQTLPVTLPVKDKLFMLPHVYGSSCYPQVYFTATDFPKNMPPIWDNQWGCVKGPSVCLGEWGGWGKGSDSVWHNALADYLIANDRRDNFYWCCGCSGDTGQIFEADFVTPVQWKIDLLKRVNPQPGVLQLGGGTVPVPGAPVPVTPPITPLPVPTPPAKPAPPGALTRLTVNMQSTYVENGDNKYQYEVIVMNISQAPLHNVYVATSNDNVVQSWNCVYNLTVNGKKCFTFPTWCTEGLLAPGASVMFGIVVTKGQATFAVSKIVV